MKPLVYVLAGAALATSLILACSDDSPGDVDAAVCDCPASEAPVPARIMTVPGDTATAPAGPAGEGSAVARCPTGAKLLSGGCSVEGGAFRDITVRHFGKDPSQENWICSWVNNGPDAQMVHAEATCLVP